MVGVTTITTKNASYGFGLLAAASLIAWAVLSLIADPEPQLFSVIVIGFLFFSAAALDIWLAHFGVYFTITCTVRRAAHWSIWIVIFFTMFFSLLLGHLFLTPACGDNGVTPEPIKGKK